MYSTCLFCHSSLGKNESIEHFPVGRRFAFDAAKGRLWVICPACERWNLTPLEERWEAIEECERAFVDSRLRVSTEHVGLARLREGVTLIRIGAPQRPEMAAWRYGDQFGRRRRKYVMLSATVVAAVGGLVVAGPIMGLVGGGVANLFNAGNLVRHSRPLARVTIDSRQYKLNRESLAHVRLLENEAHGYEIEMPYMLPWNTKVSLFAQGGPSAARWQPAITLLGDNALHAARTLLPRINASGGNAATVSDAVSILESTPQVHDAFAYTAANVRADKRFWWSRGMVRGRGSDGTATIAAMPAANRLALEMVLHEADERRALEGELATLEQRWKEAEEIASISDDMFVPSGVMEKLRRLRGG